MIAGDMEEDMSSCSYEEDSDISEDEGLGFSDSPPGSSPLVKPSTHMGNFTVLSTESTMEFMKKCLQEANSVMKLPSLTILRFLLNAFKWDKERLLEAYYDNTPAQLSSLTNLDIELNLKPVLKRKAGVLVRRGVGGTEECGICTLDRDSSDLVGLRCDHRFCNTCWKDYLRVQIMVEGQGGGALSCPAHDCRILVDDELVLRMIDTEVKVKGKYLYLITSNFVESNRSLTWCPKPNCENVIKVKNVEASPNPVACRCGYEFCFKCSNELHNPIKCDLLTKWKLKIRDESESSNWLNVNTKSCPKCSTPIEKNGGCNHMSCRSKACNHQFCWICLQNWSTHKDNFFCNTFRATAVIENDKQSLAQASLSRYLHFFNHYNAHVNSLKLETRLNTFIEAKMEEYMHTLDLSWLEAQFLQKSVECLRSCRQTLLYTYIFAYYIETNNQQVIFEGNQADLQRAVEALSGYLETTMSFTNLDELKPIILNRTNYCASRCKALVDHIQEGYDKDWWKFSVNAE